MPEYLVNGEMRVHFENVPIEADNEEHACMIVEEEYSVIDVGEYVSNVEVDDVYADEIRDDA